MSKTHVPLDQIRDNPHQARIGIGDVEGLADTILKHGLRQLPEARLLVEGEQPDSYSTWTRTYDGQWILPGDNRRVAQLASGHRRVEAVRLLRDDDTVTDADLEGAGCLVTHSTVYVPVDLQRLSDGEMLDLLTVENAQREELSPIEQARLIGELAEAGRSGEEIAGRFGKSASWVSNRKRLLDLPTYVQEHVHEGDLSVRQGQALVRAFQLEAENEELVEKLGSGAGFLPGQMTTAAVNGDLDSDGIRELTAELEEAIEMVRRAEAEAENGEEQYPELPEGWDWAPDENSDYDYRAVRRYEEWKANGSAIWLVASGDTAERAIDQAIHFDTYFVDHDPSDELVEDAEVIRPLPPGWVWVACSAKVDGIPVFTPYHFVDGRPDLPGKICKWASGKDPFDKAEEAWRMHRRSQESTQPDSSGTTDDPDRDRTDDNARDGATAGARTEEGVPHEHRGESSVGADVDADKGPGRDATHGEGPAEETAGPAKSDTSDRDVSGDGAPATVPAGWKEFAEFVEQWGQKTFPDATPDSVASHLMEEARELDAHPGAMDEAADCLLLLIQLADRQGESLLEAARRKMQVNLERTWGEPEENGVVHHVDESPNIGQVVPAQVDALLSCEFIDMWDEEAAETATIASLLVAHRVAGARQETWRTREIADAVQERVGSVTEEDVPSGVLVDVEAEVERRIQVSDSEEPEAV
jgi:ParB-like chromosome segregation protein Spo0J